MNAFFVAYISYIVVISMIAVILTVWDKRAAKRNASRVSERTLWTVAVLGGSAAMILAMFAVRHKTRQLRFMIGIPTIALLQAVITVFAVSSALTVSHYVIESDKVEGQVRLALLTDLHSCDYGVRQIELLDVIERQRPDIILLCGDIFDDVLPPDNTKHFIETVAANGAPCFYVSGNHEFWSGEADAFKEFMSERGVKVLAGTREIIDIRGNSIVVGGVDDPDTDGYASESAPYGEQLGQLSAFSAKKDAFALLMSHRPERVGELLPLEPDLIVSGHAHGGQWRLPIVLENGFVSPNQGFFPEYTNGKYEFSKEGASLIVSRGLARESTQIPRIFNRPEIVMITIT